MNLNALRTLHDAPIRLALDSVFLPPARSRDERRDLLGAVELPLRATAVQRLNPVRASRLLAHVSATALLTQRELEVLRLVAEGLSNAEIAEELVLGRETAKTHVSRVLMRLGLRDRVQAVAFAYRHGLIR